MTRWYFTFYLHQQALRDKYVVYTGTKEQAHSKMIERFGRNWAFQYAEDRFRESVMCRKLTELDPEAIDDPLRHF